ncbi:MAG: bifunctional diguanylate cyclase/phosphodiesterase [Treponema sp.]|nr:bifunctional diguanylate cyclase/phosphodiesterase [Treponema sp.]
MARDRKKDIGIENILGIASEHRGRSMLMFVFIILLYVVTEIITGRVASANGVFIIGKRPLPIASFTGVLSSISNICVIILVVFFRKRGFRVALVICTFRILNLVRGLLFAQNLQSIIPGFFTTLVTIIAILLIFQRNEKIDSYQMKLSNQATTDQLTGLPNRFACSEFISRLIQKGDKFAVVSIDLNNFKSINSTMGQKVGSNVLIEVASRWRTAAETELSGTRDFVSHLSGDEFALVLQNYRSDDDLVNAVHYYQTVLENRITVDECDFYITASFGYAEFPTDAKTTDSLFSYADAAMYEVKRTNNSIRSLRFTSDILRIERTLEIEKMIRTALEKDNVFFYLQPQFDISHKLRGFEALVRMRDEDGKMISPGEFIPVAEKVGLIDKVDGAAIKKSTAFFGDLLRRTGADITLSVNASVRHLMKNDFLDELKSALNESGLPPSQLEVEITESIMIDSADKAIQCINSIKAMGVKIAIDDFGTGYSSLSYLNKFPANLLKVDKSFIDKMNTSDSSKQYVAAIISIGHIMGFDVIAEGIEEEAQLKTLREIGCDFIQGYLWGKPLPQEEAEKLVLEGTLES